MGGDRLAIIGSRDYPTRLLPRVTDLVKQQPPGTVIVTGGAAGVDEQAERAARAFGYKVLVIPVDTAGLPEDSEERRIEFGKRAYARNTRIIETSDRVAAFWTYCLRPNCKRGPAKHRTHGTAHAISEAERLNKPLALAGPA